MTSKFPYEKAAKALSLADLATDKDVCKDLQIDTATLWRWRKRLATDRRLQALYRELKQEWRLEATQTMKRVLAAIDAAIDNLPDLSQIEIRDEWKASDLAKYIEALATLARVTDDIATGAKFMGSDNELSDD